MDFESPDVEKDFPGLYASESTRKSLSRDSDYSDEEKVSKKDLLGKRREKKESKKDKGYVAFEGESSNDELDETKSPGKSKKNRSTFKFPGKDKKEKLGKSKDIKDKKDDEKENKICKKEKECKENKKVKTKEKDKKKKDSKILRIRTSDKKKKAADSETAEDRPIFGVPLQEAVEKNRCHDGIELPVLVRECIDYIEEHGLACEGIYRISGVKSKVRQLKSQYNRGEKVYLYEHEPHIVASLLKQFLRDLPEPILTTDLVPKFEEAAAIKNEQKRVETLSRLIESLPNCNRLLLSWVFVHMLHVVSLEKRNKMNLQNVSIVLSPTMQISHRVLNVLFTHSEQLFKGVEIKKYVPPIEPDSSRLSLELPDSPTAIEEELCKQENLLNIIHEELNKGLRDKQKEEQLWEVQRVVTQLKRKLRFLRQVQDASKPEDQVRIEVKKSSPVNPAESCESSHSLPAEKSFCDSDNQISDDKISITSLQQKDPSPVENASNLKETPSSDTDETSYAVEIQKSSGDHISEITYSAETLKTDDESKVNDVAQESQLQVEECEKNENTIENDVEFSEAQQQKEELLSLYQEEMMLRIQEEELMLLGDELRRKISSERLEIERLRQEILEYQQLYKYKQYSFDSTENSSSDSDDSSNSDAEENEDLIYVLQELLKENQMLEKKKADLSKEIQKEREACVSIKVQMKLLQKYHI